MRQDLLSPNLFGNEAGDDEDIQVLNSYFVEKMEFKSFYDPNNKFLIARSRKGVGKSALLRRTFSAVDSNENVIALYLKGSDLIALQEINSSSPHSLTYGWQQRICSRITLEIGKRLQVALDDDSMTLVESAELSGFRGRNIIGSLMDRLKLKLKSIEIDIKKIVSPDKQELLKRYASEKGANVWLFIDDIDATFLNREDQRLLISTFFSACRNLVNEVHGLVLRASVRTDVWTILSQYDEALDKCDQYIIDISWLRRETGKILKKKILSYFQREYPSENKYFNLTIEKNWRDIFDLVFITPFPWGDKHVSVDRPIHILSAGRPRWAAQLCKLAGKHAVSELNERISFRDISRVMDVYGRSRLNDLYKEHHQQCPRIATIIESFAKSKKRFNTKELLKLISDRILERYGIIEIDGINNSGDSMYIAHFLYRIGFIYARNEDAAELSFVKHEERPHLLTTTANLDDGHSWEIHPSYRSVLNIK